MSCAAVLLRRKHAHQPDPAELFHQLRRINAVVIHARGDGFDLALGETARHLLNHAVFFCQLEVH